MPTGMDHYRLATSQRMIKQSNVEASEPSSGMHPKSFAMQWKTSWFCWNTFRNLHRNIRQGTASQLLVLSNRTAVHYQLLQHGFQTSWRAGYECRPPSAAGVTAFIAVIVQTACGSLRTTWRHTGRRGGLLWKDNYCADTSNPAHIHCLSGRHGWSDLHGADACSLSLRYHTLKRRNPN